MILKMLILPAILLRNLVRSHPLQRRSRNRGHYTGRDLDKVISAIFTFSQMIVPRISCGPLLSCFIVSFVSTTKNRSKLLHNGVPYSPIIIVSSDDSGKIQVLTQGIPLSHPKRMGL
jgi:hypothetical protein